MKILIVTQNFYPDNFQVNDISKELCRRGHKVTVVTGLPDYSTNSIPKEYRFFRKRHENYESVEVYRVPIISRGRGALRRFINYLSFIVSGSCFALFKHIDEFDLIYVWETSPITMAIPAIVLKKKYKKPLFLYCLDLWPECMKAFKLTESNMVYRMVGKLCQWIFKQCDRVAVSSKPFFEYVEQINKYPREKMFYLPQYSEESYLNEDFNSVENDTIDFVYTGNIGFAQNLECIIEAVELLRNVEGFQVHFVGDGSAKQSLEQMAKEKQLGEKIVFHGRVPYEQIGEYYRLADACIITLDGSSKIGDTLPAKMQGYMAAGKTIIAAMNGAGKEVIEESGCGLCVSAGDSAGLADIMKSFILNPEKYKDCGDKGREYFLQEFTKEKHFNKLFDELDMLVEGDV